MNPVAVTVDPRLNQAVTVTVKVVVGQKTRVDLINFCFIVMMNGYYMYQMH